MIDIPLWVVIVIVVLAIIYIIYSYIRGYNYGYAQGKETMEFTYGMLKCENKELKKVLEHYRNKDKVEYHDVLVEYLI